MNIVLIDFWADWCSPCKMQDTIIENLKEKYKDKVLFKKINVDGNKDEMELAEKYHISAVPTVIIEKNEKFIKRHVGVTSLKVLEKDIDKIITDKTVKKEK